MKDLTIGVLLSIKYYIRDRYYLIKALIWAYRPYSRTVRKRNGLEIGGPSKIFKFLLPVYRYCDSMTFVNYSDYTIWEGKLNQKTFYLNSKSGNQFISEASELSRFEKNSFDFIVSSNCLEHVANPLKALDEWRRVCNGNIILILPKKEFNFDHKRPFTTFEHILSDFNGNIGEDDLTHVEEILDLHDLERDAAAGSFEDFKLRSLNNFKNRCLHHHVFNNELINKMAAHVGLKVMAEGKVTGNMIFLLANQEIDFLHK